MIGPVRSRGRWSPGVLRSLEVVEVGKAHTGLRSRPLATAGMSNGKGW